MGEAFIVRRGGTGSGAEQTAIPTINFVSKTDSQIVVSFINNEQEQIDLFYGMTTPPETKITLASGGTSSNVTFSNLSQNTKFTIFAYAIVTDVTSKKNESEIVSINITTNQIRYTAATGGTIFEYDLNEKRYRSHTFTSNGTFNVTQVGDEDGDRNKIDYLIIAGGGGGAFTSASQSWWPAGAGAGGYQTTLGTSGGGSSSRPKMNVSRIAYEIIVGAGGVGSDGGAGTTNGGNSSAIGIVSIGGGKSNGPTQNGFAGGSGGGGSGGSFRGLGGTGISGQGRNGGNGVSNSVANRQYAGGGGGASGNGANGTTSGGGRGGNGLANILRTGEPEERGGGGSAVISSGTPTGRVGPNTGAGGNGSSSTSNGVAGIVVIRYEIAPV